MVQLIIDLEKMLYGPSDAKQALRHSLPKDIIHLSSDEEAHKQPQDDSLRISKPDDVPNLIFVKIDQLKQSKHLKSQEHQLLKDIVVLIQQLETKAIMDQEELEEKNKKMEELSVERQLIQSRFGSDEKAKQEQIRMFIEENDYLASEVEAKQQTIESLQERIAVLEKDAKSITSVETVAKQREIELERVRSEHEKALKESQRLQENNKVG